MQMLAHGQGSVDSKCPQHFLRVFQGGTHLWKDTLFSNLVFRDTGLDTISALRHLFQRSLSGSQDTCKPWFYE
jgi:hypothetical protein